MHKRSVLFVQEIRSKYENFQREILAFFGSPRDGRVADGNY